VYVIFNSRNGKLYVGWTNNPKERWRKHRKNAALKMQYFLYRAMVKEISNFEFKIISQHHNEVEAMLAERYWISFFKSNDDRFGYNMTEGGEGCVIRGRPSPMKGRKGKQNAIFGKRQTIESIKLRVETRMQIYNQ
jgi:group I intron endonuclease